MNLFELGAAPFLARQSAGSQAAEQNTSALWRRELERAQWAQLSRDGGVIPRRAPPEHAAKGAPSTKTQPPSTDMGSDEGGRVNADVDEQQGENAGTASPPSEELVLETRNGQAEPGGNGVETSVRPTDTTSLAPKATNSAPPFSRLAASLQWSRTNIYAVKSADGAQVWVRDAAISSTDQAKLSAALRVKLHAAGLRLSSLTVNGEVVIGCSSVHEEPDEGRLT
jgi:hypothetical protein